MDVRQIWEKAKTVIANNVSSISFDLYIKTLTAEKFEKGEFVLSALSTKDANYAKNEKHFSHIENAIKSIAPIVEKVSIIDAIEKEKRENEGKRGIEVKEERRQNNINALLNFDNFIIGKSNEAVAAAAQFVAKAPGKKINPLFIYGRSGLGKTHLLNAIANYIEEENPRASITLTTCERFTAEFVEILRKHGDFGVFREKHRNADILLIDDMQELTNKPSIQEEFFHTFNDLFEHGRQVVITSDRPPDDIKTLADRMRSRFKSGVVQDIGNPDIEMRMAILYKKASLENRYLSPEVSTYIAEHSFNNNENVREMEGHLFKVIFYAELKGKVQPDIEDCRAAIAESGENDLSKVENKGQFIIDCVAEYFNLTEDDITGNKRTKEIADARMVACYLLTENLSIPLSNIGEMLGGRSHATVIYARDKVAKQLKTDTELKKAINDILLLFNPD
ncbi:MAG: chromosomal replication initiator protein DnaA [Christensenellaceae bacterium]|jgi:chromosomal replication initiator protein|nr:chromosomal replication initiator protein DnaA [Christensenellaceae bacterium]